jgi:hypothetical protein
MAKIRHPFLQEYLFREALAEHNIIGNFSVNHQRGTCQFGPLEFGIKFPRRYVDIVSALDKQKIYDYCFIGSMDKNLGRPQLLEKFQGPQSHIVDSKYGRNPETKYEFQSDYYQIVSNSKFCLCPIHIGTWYLHDWAWTYRFIESLFCKTIPIAFKQTPLGKNFVKDVFFLWDDEPHVSGECQEIIEDNYQKALKYWTFQSSEIAQITDSLQ